MNNNSEVVLKRKLNQILEWLEKYKTETNCKGVVVGISGGKDSTVVAMLAKKVWGDNVFGVMMPDGSQHDIADSVAICSALKLKCSLVNIGGVVGKIIGDVSMAVPDIEITQKAITNIPPRIRMTVLYSIAQSMGYRVIGTGNASEAFIGWTTKFGDGAYDFNPIYHLVCREVVGIGLILAKEFNLNERYILKKPADGLTGKTDEENFGFTYEYLDGVADGSLEATPEIARLHALSEHKRNMPLTIKE